MGRLLQGFDQLKVLGKSILSFEELQTVLCDVASVINRRPLTYFSEYDLDETLTPSHSIYGRDISKSNKIGKEVIISY